MNPHSPDNEYPVGVRHDAHASPLIVSRDRIYPSNRRSGSCEAGGAYPFLLIFSTMVAGLFCYLYMSKPVIERSLAMIAPGSPSAAALPGGADDEVPAAPSESPLMPGAESLPGESPEPPAQLIAGDPRDSRVMPPANAAYEETNLRVQHILTAEAADGTIDRIVLEVPVLYQSRKLRWSHSEVGEARALLVRLMDYQDQSRALRAEGFALLDAWNNLVERSLPGTVLRADSPSLPANQEDAASAPRPADFISSGSIKVQSPVPGK